MIMIKFLENVIAMLNLVEVRGEQNASQLLAGIVSLKNLVKVLYEIEAEKTAEKGEKQ